jgi:hypothetical protein
MQVDVITPIPARWGLCGPRCMVSEAVLGLRREPDDSLEDLPPKARDKFVDLVALLEGLGRDWSGRVRFRLVDPRSLPGLWLCLRHGVRRYPSFVVPGAGTLAGTDRGALECALEGALEAAAAAPAVQRRPGFAQAVRDFLYGATVYEMVRDLNRERGQIEHLFVLVVFGDFLGVPVLPPYYTLRLLPYVMPSIRGWKLSMLRERDLTDLFVEEIH